MRLAVVSRIYRPEPAAASIFLGAVVDSALKGGMLVDVYTASPPRGMLSQTRGESVQSWPVLRDSTGYVRGYAGYVSFDIPLFFRLLFAPRPDAVLVEPPPTSGVVVRAVCALRRIPYIYDAADIWSDAAQLEPVPGAVIRMLRAVEKLALRRAAHIVTVSQGVADRIRALDSHAPVTVTGFGADATQFSYLEMPTEKLFVYAGSYSPYHGADILVEGFARFSARYPGYTLRFIGNGASRDTVKKRARELGVSSQIEFLEPVSPSALLPHLNAAVASLATIKPDTVYAYSYASKAFSSFMAGCPVIFAGSGPTIDLIDEARAAGVRAGAASAYDAESIAAQLVESVESLPSAEERRDLAEWALKNHSLQAVADRVINVISSTAAEVRR